MTLGNKIAYYRKNLAITQDALAQRLGVTNQAVSKWESDQCCPDVMLLPKIADTFGITIDELFGRQAQAKKTACTGGPDWPDDNILRVAVYVGQKMVCGGLARKGHEFSYDGDVDGVLSCVSVSCGDVEGNVDAAGNVNCGSVGGDLEAGGNVCCGNVDGDVDAGAYVSCGNVDGDVDAGTDVSCGDVDGSVDAGCNVKCGNVEGDIDAGGSVTIQK